MRNAEFMIELMDGGDLREVKSVIYVIFDVLEFLKI
jgi:hypothetical protein